MKRKVICKHCGTAIYLKKGVWMHVTGFNACIGCDGRTATPKTVKGAN